MWISKLDFFGISTAHGEREIARFFASLRWTVLPQSTQGIHKELFRAVYRTHKIARYWEFA